MSVLIAVIYLILTIQIMVFPAQNAWTTFICNYKSLLIMELLLSTLTYDDAFKIVGAFLGLSATAWGAAQIARLIFNR